MRKMQMILLFWVTLFATMHYFMYQEMVEKANLLSSTSLDFFYFKEFAKQLFMSILTISGIVIILSSVFRIENIEGELCFDINNPYWKLMKKSWNLEPQIKLCKLYWLTVFSICASYFMLFIAIGSISIIIHLLHLLFIAVSTMTLPDQSIKLLSICGFTFICFLLFFGIIAILIYLYEKGIKKIVITISVLCIAIFSYFLIKILIIPFLLITFEIFLSSKIIVIFGAILFTAMILIYLLTKLAFKYIPSLKTTIFGRLYSSAEKELCPIIYGCEFVKK